MSGTPKDIYVITLFKGEERYSFTFDYATRQECLRRLRVFASNPDLSFSWYDAAVLSQRVKEADFETDSTGPRRLHFFT